MTVPPDLRFPDGFLLGCATAAHQVEGGNRNDWTRFEESGGIKDGSTAEVACDHYRRYRDDLSVLASLGQNAHRFSVEWSRVEPEPGRFDAEALRHYADVAAVCRSHGMEPLVTLHHFTLPLWLAERGGVLAAEAPRLFARYAAACAGALGEHVRHWITVNEPVVLASLGYLYGEWPPGERSVVRMLGALRGLLRMHAAGAAALRAVAARRGGEARISIAHHVRGMHPRDPSSLPDRIAAAIPDFVLNRWFLLACRDGRLRPPAGRGEFVPGAAGSLDWIGLNYYCDDHVAFDPRRPDQLFSRREPDPLLPQSAFGWSIEPDGLRRALVRLWDEFGLPIIVTENGVADHDDELRPRFLVDHLAAVHAALEQGVDVRGYLHWTAWDNFEWAEGFSKRFGLFSVEPGTLERRPKPSAAVYARVCWSRGIPGDLLPLRAPAAP